MSSMNKLCRIAWSRWYTWVALLFGVFSFFVVLLEALRLEDVPDHLVPWVILPTVAVGCAGWSLDGAYKWLHKKQAMRWYVWVALVACLLAITFRGGRETLEKANTAESIRLYGATLDKKVRAAFSRKVDSLMDRERCLMDWQFILGSGLLVLYVGFSPDVGCQWLHKRRAAKDPEA